MIYLSVYFPTFAEPQFLLKQNSSAVQLTNCPPRPKFVNREPLPYVRKKGRRPQERQKFAYLTMKNKRFARFARAFFIFGHFADVVVLSTT